MRGPGAEGVEHQRETADDEQEAHADGEDEGDHLVLRQRRHAGADGEEGPGQQPATDVAGDDGAVIRLAEVIHRDHHGEGQQQRQPGEGPGGEELAGDRLEAGDGQGHQQFDGARLALLGPEPHGDGRHQEEVEPGMEVEEGREAGLVAFEEAAQVEGEHPGQHQEDHDEDIGQRRGEVARQLAFENHRQLRHAASPRVSRRNTSSRRPRSTSSSFTFQPRV
ncbi:hypothetical protein D3C84_353020 [compost metagenome]